MISKTMTLAKANKGPTAVLLGAGAILGTLFATTIRRLPVIGNKLPPAR